MVINEFRKSGFNHRKGDQYFFWRDHKGLEVDLIIDQGQKITPVEIKSGSTVNSTYFDSLRKFATLAKEDAYPGFVVFGGEKSEGRDWPDTMSWTEL